MMRWAGVGGLLCYAKRTMAYISSLIYWGLHDGDAKKEIKLVTDCVLGRNRPVSSHSNGQAARSEIKITLIGTDCFLRRSVVNCGHCLMVVLVKVILSCSCDGVFLCSYIHWGLTSKGSCTSSIAEGKLEKGEIARRKITRSAAARGNALGLYPKDLCHRFAPLTAIGGFPRQEYE